jgi:hypothetical protein
MAYAMNAKMADATSERTTKATALPTPRPCEVLSKFSPQRYDEFFYMPDSDA